MATNGRKRRRKIPYIGKPLTASEIRAAYPPLPANIQAVADRILAEVRAERVQREATKSKSSAKTARVR
jgi:hypothetical protein